ncbi:MAG: sialidase family protein, partial [Opitutaceae bacterium]
AGLADDGTYVALISGWPRPYLPPWQGTLEDEAKLGETQPFKDARTLQAVPAVSHDGGRTWRRYPALTEPRDPKGNALVPYGRIGSVANGELGAMLYWADAWFFTSDDHGRTWRRRGQVTTDHLHNETTWIQLGNGDLLAASRGAENSCVDAFRSTDGGTTWKPEGPLTLNGQHPADLTQLPDGRVLLSFGIRSPGLWGVGARIGDATGRTWSSPITLVDFGDSTDHPRAAEPRRDGGYPSTVVLADGTLVTAYYTRGIPEHNRYHMGVVRWRLPPAQP